VALVTLTSIASSIKRAVWRRNTIIVMALVLGFNVFVELDSVQRNLPFIQGLQLRCHRILCLALPRPLTAKWVRTVAIDNQNHQIRGITDREFLATLIANARLGRAEVIVLDFKFQAPKVKLAGEDEPDRFRQDSELLDAIKRAAHDGIPVVVTCSLRQIASRTFERWPNFYRDSDLPLPDSSDRCRLPRAEDGSWPACVRIGNINLPTDPRQIPLVTPGIVPDPGATSFALAAAAAHDDAVNLTPRTRDKSLIAKAIIKGEFLVGSFIPTTGFQTISADKLSEGDENAIRGCRGRIVLIGGNWLDDQGFGQSVDMHNTPAGPMAGMFIHANYIEALLDDRYQRMVSLPFALVFDLAVGILLYTCFQNASTVTGKLGVLGVFFLPLISAYVIFANLNWYLDFVPPLMLCFVHLIYELWREYRRLRHAENHPENQIRAAKI
jgi:CHASE2 domain-containing sensor protein